MKINISYKISLLLLPWFVSAQDTADISLSEVLSRVGEGNQSLQINEQELQSARAQYRQTQAAFLPQVSVSHTGTRTNNPVYAFGGKLNQGVFGQSDFAIDALNSPDAITNFTTNIEVKQPLINADAYLQRAALKNRSQAQNLQNKYSIAAQKLEAQKAYMQLQLAYRAQQVLRKAFRTAQAHQKISDNFYQEGIISKAQALQAAIRVAEVEEKLAEAHANVGNSSDYLRFLMNAKEERIYKPADSLSLKTYQAAQPGAVPNTSDLLAMEKAQEARMAMWNAQKMGFLPSLNAFGNYQLFDNDVFQGGSDNYLVGVQLKWDLFKGSTRLGKMQETKAEYQKARLEKEQYKSKKQLEIDKVHRNLQKLRLQLHTQKLAVQQARESLRIMADRYQQGLEKTADLQMAESALQEKELRYAQSIFNHNYTSAYYQFLTQE